MSQATMPCEYDTLTIMQKVEVFEMSLQHTAGQDLSKVRAWKKPEAESNKHSFSCLFFPLIPSKNDQEIKDGTFPHLRWDSVVEI